MPGGVGAGMTVQEQHRRPGPTVADAEGDAGCHLDVDELKAGKEHPIRVPRQLPKQRTTLPLT